jgi:hypothetical protein
VFFYANILKCIRAFRVAAFLAKAAPHNSACRITGQCAPISKRKAQLLLCVFGGGVSHESPCGAFDPTSGLLVNDAHKARQAIEHFRFAMVGETAHKSSDVNCAVLP